MKAILIAKNIDTGRVMAFDFPDLITKELFVKDMNEQYPGQFEFSKTVDSSEVYSFRCAACQQLKKENPVFLPWYRIKLGPYTQTVGFCKDCANKRDETKETGRRLRNKIKYTLLGLKL